MPRANGPSDSFRPPQVLLVGGKKTLRSQKAMATYLHGYSQTFAQNNAMLALSVKCVGPSVQSRVGVQSLPFLDPVGVLPPFPRDVFAKMAENSPENGGKTQSLRLECFLKCFGGA